LLRDTIVILDKISKSSVELKCSNTQSNIMNRLVILSILSLFSVLLCAQSLPEQFGKTTTEERNLKVYDKDTSANAIILVNYGVIEIAPTDRPNYHLTHYKKIKLLNEKAFDLADVSIPYYTKDKTERIANIQAMITLPNGEKIRLNKEDFFDESLREHVRHKTFTFPKVAAGAILEYEFTLVSKRIFRPRDFHFQEEYPIVTSKYDIISNNHIRYAILVMDNKNMKIKREEKQDNIYYSLTDIPAFKEEPFVTCYEDYRLRIVLQLSYFERAYLTTWEKTAKTLVEKTSFGVQYTKKKNFKKILLDVEPIIQSTIDPKDKVRKIYNYLNQQLEWDGKYRFIVNTSGNSGELNLLLLGVLKQMDITAAPVLISTRSNGRPIQNYPIIDQFNHAIVQVSFGEETWLLDLTDKHRPVNYIRKEALNYIGWLVDVKNPKWIEIKAHPNIKSYEGTFSLTEKGTLEGVLISTQRGYSAIHDRSLLAQETAENVSHWQNRLEELWPDIRIQDVAIEHQETIEKDLKSSIKCAIPNAAIQTNDFLYLTPILHTTWQENVFKSPERYYSIDFFYPSKELYRMTLSIPPGYVVEDLPANLTLKMPNKEAVFTYLIIQEDEHTLKIKSHINIKEVYYTPAVYPDIRAFIDIMVNKLKEQIVLKKVDIADN